MKKERIAAPAALDRAVKAAGQAWFGNYVDHVNYTAWVEFRKAIAAAITAYNEEPVGHGCIPPKPARKRQ